MTNRISKAIKNRKVKIDRLRQEIHDIQESCPHENLSYTFGGSTGNWDREDSFWIDWYCEDCEKKWQTDQDHENLKLTYLHSPRKM